MVSRILSRQYSLDIDQRIVDLAKSVRVYSILCQHDHQGGKGYAQLSSHLPFDQSNLHCSQHQLRQRFYPDGRRVIQMR